MLLRRNKYESVSLESPPTIGGSYFFFPPVRPTSFSSSATRPQHPTHLHRGTPKLVTSAISSNVLICVSYSGCCGGRCYYFSLVAPISLARSATLFPFAGAQARAPPKFPRGGGQTPQWLSVRGACNTSTFLFLRNPIHNIGLSNLTCFTSISLGILLRMIVPVVYFGN